MNSRDKLIRSQVNLKTYGISEVQIGGTILYAAEGVIPLFLSLEDALGASGWAVVVTLTDELYLEPWEGEAITPCEPDLGPGGLPHSAHDLPTQSSRWWDAFTTSFLFLIFYVFTLSVVVTISKFAR